jgi:hypothetical protein
VFLFLTFVNFLLSQQAARAAEGLGQQLDKLNPLTGGGFGSSSGGGGGGAESSIGGGARDGSVGATREGAGGKVRERGEGLLFISFFSFLLHMSAVILCSGRVLCFSLANSAAYL